MNVLVNSIEVFNSLPLNYQLGFIEFCQRKYPLFLFSYQIFSSTGGLMFIGAYPRIYEFEDTQKYLTLQQMRETQQLIAQHNINESGGIMIDPVNVLIVNVERLEVTIGDLFTLCDLAVNVEVRECSFSQCDALRDRDC